MKAQEKKPKGRPPKPKEQPEQQPKQSNEGKLLYLVTYWVPFPASEYGGLQCVIAADDEECFKLIAAHDEFEIKYHNDWQERLRARITKAMKYPLAGDQESKFVREFTT